ncbi:hypothetical protein FGG08_004993 [Glutinoglossum americanum]|uniref:JmjC domain-containing protein n=1 Tax=Glutinoglossum americanum TaxID=1670608 RepID=A0A9P8KYY4_9PEZI|nr:hypothetical protein FGG08_004993 [Glutinoglossum americanum]
MDTCSLEGAISGLIESYSEFNSQSVDELEEEPSPLEFMRYVALNRPFVVRGGCSHWLATKRWSAGYLEDRMSSARINVAITPHGNADAIVTGSSGIEYFVKPLEVQEPFSTFLKDIRQQENTCGDSGLVKYAQTRESQQCKENDNLRGEYFLLSGDVERDIAWARIALEKEPDAVNLWIGNSKSVTALHKDNYENIYCQIIGSKYFTLLSPLEVACVGERNFRSATYVKDKGGKGLRIEEDEGGQEIPFPTWDPDRPEIRPTKFSPLGKPLRVKLNAGDMLYLPALWWELYWMNPRG